MHRRHDGLRGATHALTHTALTDLTVALAAALVRKAYSKRRRSRLVVVVETAVNPRTWGLVTDSIVMVQAFAELEIWRS